MPQTVTIPAIGGKGVPERSPWRDGIEIAVAFALILAVVWTPRPWQRILWVVAAATVAFMIYDSFDGRRAMGLRTANFLRALWIPAAASLLAAIAILVAARLHTLYLPPGGPLVFVETYIAYAIWTGVQQFLLQGFFLLRFLRVVSSVTAAALAAGALFAAAHIPNPILTPVTLLWGFAACLLFARYRNLYPLAIAHAVLGITVALTIPGTVDHNMRVGLGYLTYSPYAHVHAHRSAVPASAQP